MAVISVDEIDKIFNEFVKLQGTFGDVPLSVIDVVKENFSRACQSVLQVDTAGAAIMQQRKTALYYAFKRLCFALGNPEVKIGIDGSLHASVLELAADRIEKSDHEKMLLAEAQCTIAEKDLALTAANKLLAQAEQKYQEFSRKTDRIWCQQNDTINRLASALAENKGKPGEIG